jgi:hypothetical protein
MAAAKFKISDIAKKMGKSEKDVIYQLQSLGAEVSDPNQDLEPEVIQALITGKKLTMRTRSVIMREDKKHVAAKKAAPPPPQDYTVDDAMKGVYVDRHHIDDILHALVTRRNVILQGPPGVGKTFVAKRLARAHIGTRDDSQIMMLQFHQSYSYEDFMQGFRPVDGGFALRNGPFYRLATKARNAPNDRFVLIIDEINRGNISKIFGELLMLVEHDKRESEYAVTLPYSPDELFHVPPNLYLIGMMNTADRSLAVVDYALRRRFCFFTISPAFDSKPFKEHLTAHGGTSTFVDALLRKLNALNKTIRADRGLGAGFEVGHSYFCMNDGEKCDSIWLERVIDRDLRPLLREYWFDTPDRADDEVAKLNR